MKLPFTLIVVDVETAGKPDNRVIELGAVCVTEELELGEQYRTFVKCRLPIQEDAFRVHGIKDSDLSEAPSFGEVSKRFAAWCEPWKPYVLGSWSDFDMTSLRDEHRRLEMGYPFPGHALDVKSVVFGSQAPGLNDTAIAKAVDERHRRWSEQLPRESADLWDALTGFDRDSRDALLTLQEIVREADTASVYKATALREVAAMSSSTNRYGMGSTRDMLLKFVNTA